MHCIAYLCKHAWNDVGLSTRLFEQTCMKNQPSVRFKGSQRIYGRKPCVYCWYREATCLYVGSSKMGVIRLFRKHHVIGTKELVNHDDEFVLFYFDFPISKEKLILHEKQFIRKLNPVLNVIYNNETNQDPDSVRRVRDRVHTETQLAKVLQPSMQNRKLLEISQSSKSIIITGHTKKLLERDPDKLTLDELERVERLLPALVTSAPRWLTRPQ